MSARKRIGNKKRDASPKVAGNAPNTAKVINVTEVVVIIFGLQRNW
jgi:hypothetical protein